MSKEKQLIDFAGTDEQKQQLFTFIDKSKSMRGALMPIMQKAQEIYGYLPVEVQRMIADELDIPLEEVYGVCTFYSQFSLYPKGKYKVSVCLGTACYVKGSGDIYDRLSMMLGIKNGECTADGIFSLEACRCIGACGLAPVLTVNEEVFGRLTVDDVSNIIQKFRDME